MTILKALLLSVFLWQPLSWAQVSPTENIVRNLFDGTQIISSEYIYRLDILEQTKIYSKSGKLTAWLKWQLLENGHWLRDRLDPESGLLKAREELRFKDGITPRNAKLKNTTIIKKWNFPDNIEKTPTTIEIFEDRGVVHGPNRPLKKQILDSTGNIVSELKFFYNGQESKPYRYEEYQNNQVTNVYELYEAFNPELVWQNSHLSAEEIEKRRRNLYRGDKFLVAIIDSGFDYNHEELAHHWYQNPKDPVDGVDNDNNGWVDDFMGWEREKGVGLPSESSTGMAEGWRPLSHGTHVAHIATRNLTGVGIIGFAGNYTNTDYLKDINRFLKEHKVKVVNMSFGFPADIRNHMGLRDANKVLKQMVKENPETLFVVASGNSIPGVDIDIFANRQYPAIISGKNIITVGSINSDTIEADLLDEYLMADFSNFGEKSVDILAPGQGVYAASLGGGEIRHSGTSMASPYMANEAIRLWQKYPDFSASEIKEIFMESAYPMTTAPLIFGRGFVYREKAQELAREKFVSKRWQRAKSLTQTKNGPNCWNTSLYLSGLTEGLRYVSGEEFRATIDSPLCIEVEIPQLGDVVALRRTDLEGRPLKHAMHSEIHAYTYFDVEKGLTKNGQHVLNKYEEKSHGSIFQKYKNLSRKDCRIYGIPKEYCNLRSKYYRCQSAASYLSKNPWANSSYESLYQNILSLEKSKENQNFGGEDFKEVSLELPAQGESDLDDIILERLRSLGSRID